MSAPIVPPRPARNQNPLSTSAASTDTPPIPPRPSGRRPERSQSPHRATFVRSPLNEIPFAKLHSNDTHPYGHRGNPSDVNLPRRPPSVSLPSIGQEGIEYANFDVHVDDGTNGEGEVEAPSQQRSVAGDLPLHAPQASVAPSTARSRIAPVTRTDSTQAAAAGIGKGHTEHEGREREGRGSIAQAHHGRSDSSLSAHRARSSARAEPAYTQEYEHGIPAIGQQVPMYPNAGDVQAPSPSPFGGHSTGVGYFNDSSQAGTPIGRRRSQIFIGPPGSYGLHGHSTVPRDALEKAWYEKHPEALGHEGHGEYTSTLSGNRGEAALSGEDLNRIVRETANRGIGLGTSREAIGTPTEQIGYIASEEYASRLISPRLTPAHVLKKRTSSSRSHIDSPLRKSFSLEGEHAQQARDQAEDAMESDTEEDVIHIDPPARRHDKYGGGGYDPPTEDLGPRGGNTADEGGWIDERGRRTPILASDEVAKNKGGEYLQPAVSPEREYRGSEYFSGVDSEAPPPYQIGYRGGSRSNSRPTSRPGSIHGFSGLSKVISHEMTEDRHMPLGDVEEYEPLFKDEDEKANKEDKPLTAADRLKRPLAQHRFPSQDVWEDTPESLNLQTTVESPQVPEEESSPSTVKGSSTFELPEVEQARKGEASEADRTSFLDEHMVKSPFKAHLRQEMAHRPGMTQRFPSRDIWEDTPESLRLETTVEAPQVEQIITSPEDTQNAIAAFAASKDKVGASGKPIVPPRPARAKPTEGMEVQPVVEDRPQQELQRVVAAAMQLPVAKKPSLKATSPIERKAPTLPDRPKPQVPPRPARSTQEKAEDTNILSKTLSAGSTGSEVASPGAAVLKSKPIVPARPEGKLAALKAGFMNDLNSRLKLGPQAPAKAQDKSTEGDREREQEKATLSDARKGRAKGPQRRKPVTQAGGTGAIASGDGEVNLGRNWAVREPWTVWSISINGDIEVPGSSSSTATQADALRNSAVDSGMASYVGGMTSFTNAVASSINRASDPLQNSERLQDAETKEQVNPLVESQTESAMDMPGGFADQPSTTSAQDDDKKADVHPLPESQTAPSVDMPGAFADQPPTTLGQDDEKKENANPLSESQTDSAVDMPGAFAGQSPTAPAQDEEKKENVIPLSASENAPTSSVDVPGGFDDQPPTMAQDDEKKESAGPLPASQTTSSSSVDMPGAFSDQPPTSVQDDEKKENVDPLPASQTASSSSSVDMPGAFSDQPPTTSVQDDKKDNVNPLPKSQTESAAYVPGALPRPVTGWKGDRKH